MEVIHVTVIFFHVNHKLVFLAMTKIMCYLLFSRINHVLWTITVVMPPSLALVVVVQPPGLSWHCQDSTMAMVVAVAMAGVST
jgi:hypothetical protein